MSRFSSPYPGGLTKRVKPFFPWTAVHHNSRTLTLIWYVRPVYCSFLVVTCVLGYRPRWTICYHLVCVCFFVITISVVLRRTCESITTNEPRSAHLYIVPVSTELEMGLDISKLSRYFGYTDMSVSYHIGGFNKGSFRHIVEKWNIYWSFFYNFAHFFCLLLLYICVVIISTITETKMAK